MMGDLGKGTSTKEYLSLVLRNGMTVGDLIEELKQLPPKSVIGVCNPPYETVHIDRLRFPVDVTPPVV